MNENFKKNVEKKINKNQLQEEIKKDARIEAYLDTIDDEEARKIESEILYNKKNKRQQQLEKKIQTNNIVEIAKNLMDANYVSIDTDVNITFAEKMVATAIVNSINNPKTNFAEIINAQKVLKDETNNSINISINSNGEDLGD